jgi:uncharacterized protein
MNEPDSRGARAARFALPRLPGKVRAAIRALHRDAGYLAVGLTLIYAASGLAVNHLEDWDPNFTQLQREYQLQLPTGADDTAIATAVLTQLDVREAPSSVYRVSPDRLEITLAESSLFVAANGHVMQEGQSPRLLLRAANWLHLNRGKRAWTYVADAYAVTLLGLALSGLFMIPGRKGFWGRGAVLVVLGALVPTLYVALNGP